MIQQVELLAASFSDQRTANRCLDQLKRIDKQGAIDLIDAAVLVKQADGKLKINEVEELTPKKGRRRGAVIGGIFGAIFPPSLLVSAVVGAVAGGAMGRFTDQGFKNDDLKAIGDELEPGHSAIIAIVEDKWVEQFTAAVDGYERLSRISMDAEEAGVIILANDPESGETRGIAATKSAQAPASEQAGSMTASDTPELDTRT
ncbi:MAG: DUF1269 domain-containing protein [Thermomicrobiales bacterium]